MARITDLSLDVLNVIMILVANSPDGAADFARATSVCRMFWEITEEGEVLKALSFDNMSISNRHRLFQLSNNLLFRCANLGNLSAQHLLSKILLVSTSHLYKKRDKVRVQLWSRLHSAPRICNEILDEDIVATNFVARVRRDPTCSHLWNLVRNFLRRCSPQELLEVGECLSHYLRCFSWLKAFHRLEFEYCIGAMIMFASDIIAAAEVDLSVTTGILDEKYKALEVMPETFPCTVEEEALITEIEDLQSRVSIVCEFGSIDELGTVHEKDPAIYFEECAVMLCVILVIFSLNLFELIARHWSVGQN